MIQADLPRLLEFSNNSGRFFNFPRNKKGEASIGDRSLSREKFVQYGNTNFNIA